MNYGSVLEMARGSRGRDKDGYRAEFIRLAELSSDQLTLRDDEE